MSLRNWTPCDEPDLEGRHHCPYADDGDYVNCEWYCGAEEPQDNPEVWEEDEEDLEDWLSDDDDEEEDDYEDLENMDDEDLLLLLLFTKN
jgi:hypothetical protein